MIDFVFAVDNPVEWHAENLRRNASHYSALGWLGPRTVAWVQEGFGAAIYYNTLVKCDGRLIKYGVMSTQALVEDCEQWRWLYVAGRLQKPVAILRLPADEKAATRLDSALKGNLWSAVCVAALLESGRSDVVEIPAVQLWHTVAGLSYSGDFRMTFGENPHKVSNIVLGNVQAFDRLYHSQLQRAADRQLIPTTAGSGLPFIEVKSSRDAGVADTIVVSSVKLSAFLLARD